MVLVRIAMITFIMNQRKQQKEEEEEEEEEEGVYFIKPNQSARLAPKDRKIHG